MCHEPPVCPRTCHIPYPGVTSFRGEGGTAVTSGHTPLCCCYARRSPRVATSLAKPPGSTLAACFHRALATVSEPIVVPSRESFTDPTSWVGTTAHRFFFRCQSTHRRRIGVVWIDYYRDLPCAVLSVQAMAEPMDAGARILFLNHFCKFLPAPALILIDLVMSQAALT